eukprot:SAG22_NODE_516_length_9563_cov_29.476965_4_plen_44_part_00
MNDWQEKKFKEEIEQKDAEAGLNTLTQQGSRVNIHGDRVPEDL